VRTVKSSRIGKMSWSLALTCAALDTAASLTLDCLGSRLLEVVDDVLTDALQFAAGVRSTTLATRAPA